MESIREHFQRAWRGVIAPLKYSYNINSVFNKQQTHQGQTFERVDLNVVNDQGKAISALLIKQKHKNVREAILYFHGNGGTKIQILGLVPHLANHDIALIAFDYVGCGNSDEGYLTYGVNETSDAEVVLREAYRYINVERLTVWGRSMGAVTAINFAVKNPKITDRLILDSPFRLLESVIKRVIYQETKMPQVLAGVLTYFLTKEIEEKLKFPLFAEDYLSLFRKVSKNISTLFVCSDNDIVVPKQEVELFYRAFKGDRQILEITESHEQDRGVAVYTSIICWIKRQKSRKNLKLRLYSPADGLTIESSQVYSYC